MGAADDDQAPKHAFALTTSSTDDAPTHPQSKIHPALTRQWAARGDQPLKAWVLLADKGLTTSRAHGDALNRTAAEYNPRAIHRRQLRRTLPGLFDDHDLPVSAGYVDQIAAEGATVHVVSKWVNAVSVRATRAQLERIAQFPFVRLIQPVRWGRGAEPMDLDAKPLPRASAPSPAAILGAFYGESEEQLTQINLVALHNAGFTATGVIVGILDTGFERSHVAFNEPGHPVSVVAEHDFVSNDGDTSFNPADTPGQHTHGTYILGTLGAYKPGELVGGAYNASFILCKTEDIASETPVEEDNYVAGLEFIELNGGDMATASLGYIDWYTQVDLDGMTAITTIAVNIATANGLHCLNAAGNAGHDANPSTSSLIAPTDALQVLSIGAVDNLGFIMSFSSDGPTADGRTKPELLARGGNTRTVSPIDPNAYVGVGGTSLSTPLAAGAVACLIQAHPTWTVDQMRTYLMLTADYYVANGEYEPTYVRGYGIINAFAASAQDCNFNSVNDLVDIAGATPDCNGNSIPDSCDLAAGTSRDCQPNGIPDECDIANCTGNPACADCNADGIPDDCVIPCNNHGTCANGTCLCDTGFVGLACDQCAPNYYNYPTCTFCQAAATCSSNGTCNTLGGCNCITGFAGVACNLCAPNYYNYPTCTFCVAASTCSGNGVCNGLGACVCNAGWIGPNCATPLVNAPTAPIGQAGFKKNRFVSFVPSNGATPVNYRVRHTGTGKMKWVLPPAGAADIAANYSRLTGDGLVGTKPAVAVWGQPVIHATDCMIIPVQTAALLSAYEVTATTDGVLFSPALTVDTIDKPGTKFWADCVGPLALGVFGPPNLLTDFVDINAAVQRFQNTATAPLLPLVDINPQDVDTLLNFADINRIVQGFQGQTYPFLPPTACP